MIFLLGLCPVVPKSRANIGIFFVSHEYLMDFDEIWVQIN